MALHFTRDAHTRMLEKGNAAAAGRAELETIKGFANTDVRSPSIKLQTGVVKKSF